MEQQKYEERRGSKRRQSREALNLKIVFSSENPGLLGRTISGSTVDISATGLRIEMKQKIKLDSVLDVWVTLKDNHKKYFLTGNVRWCSEESASGVYQIGVVLRERSDTVTDLDGWRAAFKN